MTGGDDYVLGYRQAEQERLQEQAELLADESARLFDEIGISDGARVVEIGCGPRGCLGLLSRRAGVAGYVIGVEINADAVALAQRFVTEHALTNVEVRVGDARCTGLPERSFDLITSRLVLVNIPRPEEIVSHAVSLAQPGGAVAFHEVDWVAVLCDPPSSAWNTVVELILAAADKNGNDYHLGRRLPRLLREAGLIDIRITPIVHAYRRDHPRSKLLVHFVDNFSERILALDLVTDDELAELKLALHEDLDEPDTVVFDGLYVQAWGRKPLD